MAEKPHTHAAKKDRSPSSSLESLRRGVVLAQQQNIHGETLSRKRQFEEETRAERMEPKPGAPHIGLSPAAHPR